MRAPDADVPDFESPDFLHDRIESILAFYEPRVLAPEGGFRTCFLDDGDCYDPSVRQRVGSARYVVTDHHTMGACRDVPSVMGAPSRRATQAD